MSTTTSRIGNGFDVHPLVAGRRLVLGGVTLPFDRGLAGHSDADVLLHAICDAVLGAIGEGDLGRHFPDTDAAYKDADSRVLLKSVWQRAVAAGYALGNVDVTVIAEAPRLAPYIAQITAIDGRSGAPSGLTVSCTAPAAFARLSDSNMT